MELFFGNCLDYIHRQSGLLKTFEKRKLLEKYSEGHNTLGAQYKSYCPKILNLLLTDYMLKEKIYGLQLLLITVVVIYPLFSINSCLIIFHSYFYNYIHTDDVT